MRPVLLAGVSAALLFPASATASPTCLIGAPSPSFEVTEVGPTAARIEGRTGDVPCAQRATIRVDVAGADGVYMPVAMYADTARFEHRFEGLTPQSSYSVRISADNAYGARMSAPRAIVTSPAAAPVLLARPVATPTGPGSAKCDGHSWSGGGDVTYRWRRDGLELAGQTNSVLAVAVQMNPYGWYPLPSYRCVVTMTNTAGSAMAMSAAVSLPRADTGPVIPVPAVPRPKRDAPLLLPQRPVAGDHVRCDAVSPSTASSWEWLFDGVPLGGQGGILATAVTDAGHTIACRVGYPDGEVVTSEPVVLAAPPAGEIDDAAVVQSVRSVIDLRLSRWRAHGRRGSVSVRTSVAGRLIVVWRRGDLVVARGAAQLKAGARRSVTIAPTGRGARLLRRRPGIAVTESATLIPVSGRPLVSRRRIRPGR
jgi:hypothetical protein